MKRLTTFLALALSTTALAGTVQLNWTNPTAYTDSTPFPPSDYKQTRVEYGQCDGVAFPTTGLTIATVAQNAATPVTTYTVTNLANSPQQSPAIKYCFRLYADSILYGASSPTNFVSATMPVHAPPNPPTNVIIGTITATAPITIPAGTYKVALIPAP